MKIKLFGTGSIPSKSLSSCALIDDTILLDCPNGLVKRLRCADTDFNAVRLILITHFHGDHDFDMPFLLREFNKVPRQEALTIISPYGFEERYKALYTLALPDTFDTVYENAKLEVIELAPRNTSETDDADCVGVYQVADYEITVFRMQHSCEAYGYKIKKGDKVVAFTGDSVMCDGVLKVIDDAQVAFVDVTAKNAGSVHMGVEDIVALRAQFPKCRLIPVHMSDPTREVLRDAQFEVPNDDDVFVI